MDFQNANKLLERGERGTIGFVFHVFLADNGHQRSGSRGVVH